MRDYSGKNPCISARGQKPLHFAAMSGQMQICEKILGNVANKYPKDNRGKTPLHYASENGYIDLCLLLINYNSDINAKNIFGRTPLHNAASKGHLEMCTFFINNGADPNITDEHKQTPLHYAAQEGNLSICQFFLDKGALKNPGDDWRMTPLHDAALHGHLKICKLFIDHVEDISSRNIKGYTPLFIAFKKCNFTVCYPLAWKTMKKKWSRFTQRDWSIQLSVIFFENYQRPIHEQVEALTHERDMLKKSIFHCFAMFTNIIAYVFI